MGKKASTIEEQIEKLVCRGLVMDLGVEKTKEIPLDIGYYRLGFTYLYLFIDKMYFYRYITS